MAIWTCERCGSEFKRDRAGTRVIRFCSQKCYHEWNRESGDNAGRFSKDNPPWNKGTKGTVKPNSGTFQVGHELGLVAVGTTTIRNDKAGRKRAWVKVADNRDAYDWKMRAVVVWENENGAVQFGRVVHHKDHDTLNDDIENLDVLSRAEHLAEHRPQHEERKRNDRAKKQGAKAPVEIL